MEEFLQGISVPIIVAAVYWLMNFLKMAVHNQEKYMRLIPLIAAVTGGVLGVLAFYFMPTMIPADNVIRAILIGGASGLAATGTNQIFKQMGKDDNTKTLPYKKTNPPNKKPNVM